MAMITNVVKIQDISWERKFALFSKVKEPNMNIVVAKYHLLFICSNDFY